MFPSRVVELCDPIEADSYRAESNFNIDGMLLKRGNGSQRGLQALSVPAQVLISSRRKIKYILFHVRLTS